MKKIHSLKIFRISGKRSKKASTSSKIESIGRQNSFKTLRTREMERKKGASFSSPSAFRFVRCEFPRFNIEMIYIFAGGANGPPQKVVQSERWLHPFSSFLCSSIITTIPSLVEKSKHCIHGSRGNSEWCDNDGGGTDRYDRGNEGLVI